MNKPVFSISPDVFALAREESDRVRMSQAVAQINNLTNNNRRLSEHIERLSDIDSANKEIISRAVNFFNGASDALYKITASDQTSQSLSENFIHHAMGAFAYQALYSSMSMKGGQLGVAWNTKSARQYNLMMISAYYCYQMLEELPTKFRVWYSRWDSLCQGMSPEEKSKCWISFSELNNNSLKLFEQKTIYQTIIGVKRSLIAQAKYDSDADTWPSSDLFQPGKFDYCIDINKLLNKVLNKNQEADRYQFSEGKMPSSLEMVLAPRYITQESKYSLPLLLKNDSDKFKAIPYSVDVIDRMKSNRP